MEKAETVAGDCFNMSIPLWYHGQVVPLVDGLVGYFCCYRLVEQ